MYMRYINRITLDSVRVQNVLNDEALTEDQLLLNAEDAMLYNNEEESLFEEDNGLLYV